MLIVCARIVPAQTKGPLIPPWQECVRKQNTHTRYMQSGIQGISFVVSENSGDSNRQNIKPKTAMLHSLILPGWGQLNNGSRKKAAFFFAAEAFCIGGYIYENHQSKQSGLSSFEREAYKTDRNSFVMYWLVAKILGITEAYVDAQLSDFDVKDITPEELKKPEKPEKPTEQKLNLNP